MSMMTPMNCVKRMSGVKKDHTGHSAMLKLQRKAEKYYQMMTILPQQTIFRSISTKHIYKWSFFGYHVYI